MTGAALFRVETVEPYPESYGSATEIVKDELQRGVIRPIRPLAFNPDDYDVVVLGTTGPCARRTQRSGKRLSLPPETQSRTGIRHGED